MCLSKLIFSEIIFASIHCDCIYLRFVSAINEYERDLQRTSNTFENKLSYEYIFPLLFLDSFIGT
jgi:hypothetical protein